MPIRRIMSACLLFLMLTTTHLCAEENQLHGNIFDPGHLTPIDSRLKVQAGDPAPEGDCIGYSSNTQDFTLLADLTEDQYTTYDVHLVDPVPVHLEQARARSASGRASVAMRSAIVWCPAGAAVAQKSAAAMIAALR